MARLTGGINRRQLDEILSRLGGKVISIHRTGEIQYTHPLVDERPRADGRRKDAPRHLVAFVRKVQRAVEEARDDNQAA